MRSLFNLLIFALLSSCSGAGNAPSISKGVGSQNKNAADETKSSSNPPKSKNDEGPKIEVGEKPPAEKVFSNGNATQKETVVQKENMMPENGIKPAPSGQTAQVTSPAAMNSAGGQMPGAVGNASQTIDDSAYQIHPLENEVMKAVNEYRKSKGLSVLAPQTRAFMQSRVHCDNIKKGLYPMGHEGFRDRLRIIIKAVPSGTIFASAENVAPSGGADAAGIALRGWLGSPGHRRNIEGDFTHAGTGMAQYASGNYVLTQIFLKL
jgi:uncharacterized protein YkwD